MAKFEVLTKFRLLDNQEVKDVGPVHEVGDVIDISAKRAAEVTKNLGDSFLVRVNEKKDADEQNEAEILADVIEEPTNEEVDEGDK